MNEYEPDEDEWYPYTNRWDAEAAMESDRMQRLHHVLVLLGFVDCSWKETSSLWRLGLRDALRKSGL